mgnify:FL=1
MVCQQCGVRVGVVCTCLHVADARHINTAGVVAGSIVTGETAAHEVAKALELGMKSRL